MAQIFDVTLMERRAEKHISSSEWLSYLYDFFDHDRPLHQLFDELLSADGIDPERRPAARFLLDREADSHVLARDVGRIAFGRDLQCAQCHDHPLVDDYRQRDYFALLAFFTGTKVFTTNDKKVILTDESGGGVSYRSVFDSSATGTAYPRVPGGKQIDISKVAGDADTKPSTTNGEPVPKSSLRGRMAFEVSHSRQFARNLANRLWAMLMGRGLTDPVDLLHAENAPVHPELLELLTDELLARNFRLKSLVREIALTQTYQRATELPADLKFFAATASTQIPRLIQQRDQLAEISAASAAMVAKTRDELSKAQQQAASLGQTLQNCETVVASARSATDEANKSCRSIDIKRQDIMSKAQVFAEAAAKAEAAAVLLPSETDLADASRRFKTRATQFEAELVDVSSEVAKTEAASRAADAKLTTAQRARDDTSAELKVAQSRIADVEPDCDSTLQRATYDRAELQLLDSRLSAAKALSGFEADSVDPELIVKSRGEVMRCWRREWLVGSLRPLSPEQLAWSAMKAAGVVDAELAVATAEVDRAMARSEVLLMDAAARGRNIEQRVFAKLSKGIERFAKLYGAPTGLPQNEFFATADQALFFTNSADICSWLAPHGENLTARLSEIADTTSLVEELYLSIYTRRPSDEEAVMVFGYLNERGAVRTDNQAERSCALQELVWAMLASAEFRFIQ
jgi:hypothetical protein